MKAQQFISKLNIADWFSIARLLSTPFLVVLALMELRLIFAIVLFVSFLTDAIDGYLARRLKIASDHGAQLDSIADASLFVTGVFGVIWFETEFVIEQYLLISISLALYFAQLFMGLWRYRKPSSFHTYLAKIAAFVQGAFLCTLFFFGVIYWLFYLTIIIGIAETIEEIALIWILPKWRTNVKGLYWAIKNKMWQVKRKINDKRIKLVKRKNHAKNSMSS